MAHRHEHHRRTLTAPTGVGGVECHPTHTVFSQPRPEHHPSCQTPAFPTETLAFPPNASATAQAHDRKASEPSEALGPVGRKEPTSGGVFHRHTITWFSGCRTANSEGMEKIAWSTRELLTLGLTDREIRNRIARGSLVRVRRGHYVISGETARRPRTCDCWPPPPPPGSRERHKPHQRRSSSRASSQPSRSGTGDDDPAHPGPWLPVGKTSGSAHRNHGCRGHINRAHPGDDTGPDGL